MFKAVDTNSYSSTPRTAPLKLLIKRIDDLQSGNFERSLLAARAELPQSFAALKELDQNDLPVDSLEAMASVYATVFKALDDRKPPETLTPQRLFDVGLNLLRPGDQTRGNSKLEECPKISFAEFVPRRQDLRQNIFSSLPLLVTTICGNTPGPLYEFGRDFCAISARIPYGTKPPKRRPRREVPQPIVEPAASVPTPEPERLPPAPPMGSQKISPEQLVTEAKKLLADATTVGNALRTFLEFVDTAISDNRRSALNAVKNPDPVAEKWGDGIIIAVGSMKQIVVNSPHDGHSAHPYGTSPTVANGRLEVIEDRLRTLVVSMLLVQRPEFKTSIEMMVGVLQKKIDKIAGKRIDPGDSNT